VEFLISRGAQHHIFSAVAMNLADEVRRMVTADSAALHQRQSRNENHQTPLQFAVRMNRAAMVQLLLDIGADPLAVDGSGMPVAGYATGPDIDLPVMQKIAAMTMAEFERAAIDRRPPNPTAVHLLAAVALRAWDTASAILAANPEVNANGGALHLLAKRGDAMGVKWLLDRGAHADALWPHWDAEVTALHLAALSGATDVARVLIDAGANPRIHDSKHDSDAVGWAQFFNRPEIVRIVEPFDGSRPSNHR
jgi:ankyrin repeat protein